MCDLITGRAKRRQLETNANHVGGTFIQNINWYDRSMWKRFVLQEQKEVKMKTNPMN